MPGLRLDGYVRVSRVGGRGGDSFISPNDQRDRIAAWAMSRDVEIAAWHEDLDQTGGKLSRPGLDELMRRIRAKETGGVAVAYVDRLSRANVGDALRLVEEIHDAGGQFAALDLGIDPTTPFGEFGLTVMLALARMNRRRISDGWDTATGRAIGRGVHVKMPFGYRKSAGKGSKLEPDPTTAPIVAELFRRRADGESWASLVRWMDSRVKPRRGELWTRGAVETIIANRAYLGEARYGRHLNADAHVPLVTLAEWEAAQKARALRPSRGEPGLLSGIVRCAGCRYRLQAARAGRARTRVYRCRQRHNAGECPAPAYVMRESLDAHIERLFLQRYGGISLEARVGNPELEGAQSRLAEAEAELAAWLQNTSARAMLERLGGDHFETALSARVTAVESAREAFEATRREATGMNLGPVLERWEDLTVQERRRVMAEGIDAVFLRRVDSSGSVSIDQRVKVFWRGEAPGDLPGTGIRVDLRSIDW
jgi:site-specific DNA recombinase